MSTLRLCENVIFFKLIFISGTKKPTKPNDFVGLNRIRYYLLMLETTPAPTVRPPSRIENLVPSSIAIGAISSTASSMLS